METTRIRRRGLTPFPTGLSIHCTPFLVDELAVPSGQYERQQGRVPPRHRQHCGIYRGNGPETVARYPLPKMELPPGCPSS